MIKENKKSYILHAFKENIKDKHGQVKSDFVEIGEIEASVFCISSCDKKDDIRYRIKNFIGLIDKNIEIQEKYKLIELNSNRAYIVTSVAVGSVYKKIELECE